MVNRTLVIIVVAITVASAIAGLLVFTPRSAEVNPTVCPSGFEGTVTDQDSQPVDGIRVVVSGLVSGMANIPEIAPETDLAGSYSFASITLQTAEVEIEVAVHGMDGSRVGLEVVTLTCGETSILDFVIQSSMNDLGGMN